MSLHTHNESKAIQASKPWHHATSTARHDLLEAVLGSIFNIQTARGHLRHRNETAGAVFRISFGQPPSSNPDVACPQAGCLGPSKPPSGQNGRWSPKSGMRANPQGMACTGKTQKNKYSVSNLKPMSLPLRTKSISIYQLQAIVEAPEVVETGTSRNLY